MGLGSRLYPNGILQVPTYFDDHTTLTGASVRLTENFYLAKLLDEVTIAGAGGGLAKREYSNGTLAVANSFDEITLANFPSSTIPTFSTTARAMKGYYANGRAGWSYGAEIPTSYDDGLATFSGSVYPLMPTGLSWYINNVPYSSYYVSANGNLTFNSGSGAIWGDQPTANFGFYFCVGDQYWGTNGANGTGNTPNAFAFRKGATSNGWQFFSANLQGYQYVVPGNDRTWEVNCFWNYDNSVQLVEFVYSPVWASFATSVGITSNNIIYPASGFTPTANSSCAFSSTDKGVTWTYAGAGSWSVGTF